MSLYQQAYHFLASNKGGAAGRRKAMKTLRKTGSPAFIRACEMVVRNNPHFFRDKSDSQYVVLKKKSFDRKGRVNSPVKSSNRNDDKKARNQSKSQRSSVRPPWWNPELERLEELERTHSLNSKDPSINLEALRSGKKSFYDFSEEQRDAMISYVERASGISAVEKDAICNYLMD
ncbi:hypothetical protein [Candidatus Methanoprimaticola sp. MG2]|uniref:hypothetical protein n=1 Tax=Candidatus Methanoprimaticola sp. MG2 TaxID=3228838 RepID=UPI0039C6D698